jgi:flagellum-specific peptidoglycan hydrolase FlgJ
MLQKIKDFLLELKDDAKKVNKEKGYDHLFILAQVALETGWLKHINNDINTGENSYNLFNIKGDYKGESVTILTTEYDKDKDAFNGDNVVNKKLVERNDDKFYKFTLKDKFRKYPSYKESILDWLDLLEGNRYKEARKVKNNYKKLAHAIYKCGYATDPQYPKKIISIADLIKKNLFMLEHNIKTLTQGDRGNQVRQLQEMLSQVGYNLTIDGIYGPGTEEKVKKFQKDNNNTIDGIAGPSTFYQLHQLV